MITRGRRRGQDDCNGAFVVRGILVTHALESMRLSEYVDMSKETSHSPVGTIYAVMAFNEIRRRMNTPLFDTQFADSTLRGMYKIALKTPPYEKPVQVAKALSSRMELGRSHRRCRSSKYRSVHGAVSNNSIVNIKMASICIWIPRRGMAEL